MALPDAVNSRFTHRYIVAPTNTSPATPSFSDDLMVVASTDVHDRLG
jgi:hypothetical protein